MKTITKETTVYEKKTVTKELNVLERSDIEQALSRELGEPISIEDIHCYLEYYIHEESGEFCCMDLIFEVGEESRDGMDLFWDEKAEGHYIDGKRLCLNEPWLPKEALFDFDISLFKDFSIIVSTY